MTDVVTSSASVSPYRGLRAYDEEDAAFFFGRDVESDVIIANLRASRLTVLYGPSGVGKSSLLRAGVEARLRERSASNAKRLGTPEFIPVVFDTWQDDPEPALSRAIADEVRRWTREAVEPATSLAGAISAASELTNAALLVILDQFEELSLYHGARNGASAFVSVFPDLVKDKGLRVNFLVSLREDAIAQLDRFKRSIPGLLDTRLRVNPLTGDAARNAVTGPIARYNEVAKPKTPVAIEDELVAAVLNQVEIGKVRAAHAGLGLVPGAGKAADGDTNQAELEHERGVEASYLQLVMQRLWDHEMNAVADSGAAPVLRLSTLQQLGGAQTIVREHLRDALGDLSRVETDAALDVFEYLVTPSGTKITQGLGTLAAWSGHSSEEVASLFQKLQGDARIIRLVPPEPGSDEDRYEIFHDVLAGAILEWSSGQNEQRRLAKLAEDNARLEEQKHEAEKRAAVERRRRLIAVGLLLIAVAACAVAIVAWKRAQSANTKAEHEGALATYSGLTSAAQAMLQSRPDTSLLLALEAYSNPPPSLSPTMARAALIAALDAFHRSGSDVLHGHTDTVTSVAFHGTSLASASADGTIRLWNAQNLKLLGTLRAPRRDGVFSVAFTRDGRTLAAGYADGLVRIWKVGSRRVVDESSTGSGGPVITVAFSRDGRMLAAVHLNQRIVLWNLVNGSKLGNPRPIPDPGVRSLAFSPDSLRLAGAGQTPDGHQGMIKLWTLGSGGPVPSGQSPSSGSGGGFKRPLYAIAFGLDGRLAAGGLSGQIYSVNRTTGANEGEIACTGSPDCSKTKAVDGIAYSPDGRLAAATADGAIYVWQFGSKKTTQVFTGHTAMATSVAFSGAGDILASGSTDQTVRLWHRHSPGDFQRTLEQGATNADSVAFAHNGMLASARSVSNNTSNIELWSSGRQIRSFPTNAGPIKSLAFDPSGRLLLTGSGGGTVQLWDIPSGKAHGPPLFTGHLEINSVAFSPNGRWVAFNTRPGQVRLESPTTRKWHTLAAPPGAVYAVAFNHDGSLLAAGGDGKTIGIWVVPSRGVPSREPRATLVGHTDAVFALAFSPTGGLLASGSADDTIRLWRASTGQPVGQPMTGHHDWVRTLAFAPGGRLLASGSADNTVRLWDLTVTATGVETEPADTFSLPGFLNGVAFSPDGMTLAAVNRHGPGPGALTQWSPVGLPVALTKTVCGYVGGGLSAAEQRPYGLTKPYEPCVGIQR